MMVTRVFIDGEAGTTGLQLRKRLAERPDIVLHSLADTERKDRRARAERLNAADIVILCLPDEAAREAVSMIENPSVRVIDASTAHRTAPGWVYGFPEWGQAQPQRIAAARRVTNPGCYPTGAISLLHPLILAGLVPADWPVAIHAVSGYTGGGRKLIESFENREAPERIDEPFRLYALGLDHKHVEEIRIHSGLTHRPLFVPSIGRFRQGMIVQIPLQLWALPGKPGIGDLHRILTDHYRHTAFVRVAGLDECAAADHLAPEGLNGTNLLKLYVFGNADKEQAVLAALMDNLGKGASGQAVQNLNLMMGVAEETGLDQFTLYA